jgi:hypothetical protein
VTAEYGPAEFDGGRLLALVLVLTLAIMLLSLAMAWVVWL